MDNINWRLLIVIYILLAGVWGTLVKVASDRLNPLTMSFIVSTSAWLAVAAVVLPRTDFMKRTKKTIFIGITGLMLISGGVVQYSFCSDNVEIANPASVYCVQSGYTLEIRTSASGDQYGVCIFPDGNECEEWAFFRNECGARYRTLPDVKGNNAPEED